MTILRELPKLNIHLPLFKNAFEQLITEEGLHSLRNNIQAY